MANREINTKELEDRFRERGYTCGCCGKWPCAAREALPNPTSPGKDKTTDAN